MKTHLFRFLLPAIVIATSAATWAFAGDWCCCSFCGCNKDCNKRCRLVCEEKKVEVVCWGCKCEDFCTPGCGRPGCKHCDEVCTSCNDPANKDGVCCESKNFLWREWCPWGKPHMYTKTKLLKKIEIRKVPSYKWVVEDVCAECEVQNPAPPVPAGAPLPPAPYDDAPTTGKVPGKAGKSEK